MGLFGFIGKIAKTVARAGLSTVTGGLSDQVIAGINERKRQKYLSTIEQAQMSRYAPQVKGVGRLSSLPQDLFSYQQEETGETPGERAARKRAKRLANLAKARAARKKKDEAS